MSFSRHAGALSPGGFGARSGRPLSLGFSLVEILVVLAIISVLATLGAASINSVLEGRSVANAVNTASSAAATARQTAISKGKPVAFVVSRSTGQGVDDTQSVIALEFEGVDSDGHNIWTPVTAWTALPSRVMTSVYLRGATASFYAGGAGVVMTLPVTLKGMAPDFDYVVFQPDGGVDAPAMGPSLTFRRLNKSGTATDYTLVLPSDSGRSKIIGG